MSHPRTLPLATMLARAPEDMDTTCDALSALFQDYTDEQKADLYALIQEAVNETMSFVELSDALDGCLVKNEEHFK
jgi:hypothetical protein